MKRLGMLLVLVSVGLFALGCEKPAETTPPATPPGEEAVEGGETTVDPVAEPQAEGEEK